jgi:hypothetical protein
MALDIDAHIWDVFRVLHVAIAAEEPTEGWELTFTNPTASYAQIVTCFLSGVQWWSLQSILPRFHVIVWQKHFQRCVLWWWDDDSLLALMWGDCGFWRNLKRHFLGNLSRQVSPCAMNERGIFTANSGIVYHTTKSFCILGLRLRSRHINNHYVIRQKWYKLYSCSPFFWWLSFSWGFNSTQAHCLMWNAY